MPGRPDTGFRERLEAVETRIRRACEACSRERRSVELLPVSKYQPLDLLREALASGLDTFGENYVQEGSSKARELPEARFVLLGPLQRNKVKPALQAFRALQSLDRPALAQRLRLLAEELQVCCPVWIQVDLWGEDTKEGGCSEAELPALLEALNQDPRLPLQGFMALPPPGLTSAFSDMAKLRSRWQDRLGQALRLSMGMSGDLEEAIRQGSDQVRIGTALFGER